MSGFVGLVRRFGRDERGVFAVIFGIMAIVLVALGGAVVDYVSLEQTRSRAQTALDAAALALQPEILKPNYDEQLIRRQAEAMMIERIGDARVTAEVDDITVVVEDGSLYFHARFSMPTTFVSLVGVPTLGAAVESEASRKKLELEVVMVLDNSGSMQDESRMTRLVEAARCATYILMYESVVPAPGNNNTCVPAAGAAQVEDVRVGIVPFTMYVNVGANNANAAWIDRTGASSIHFDNFDNDDDEDRLVLSRTSPNYSFPTRQTLFAATGEAWRGCVEARPHTKSGTLTTEYLDTDDTPATGGDTLYVPMFSPDTVGGNNNFITNDSPAICDRPAYTSGGSSTTCQQRQVYTGCNSGMSNGSCSLSQDTTTPQGPLDFVSNDKYPNAFYGNHAPSCSCRTWTSWTGYNQTSGSGNNRTFERTRSCSGGGYVPTGLTTRELQERVCKYYGGINTSNFSVGPNSQCTRTPILPLTSNPSTVINTINAMQAEGGTNIHEGAVWGFRVLSPGEPFSEGGPYNEAISKVMIIMTDGENTAYQTNNLNGASYNSAYGFPYNSMNNKAASTSGGTVERLGKLANPTNTGAVGVNNAHLVTEMNTRTSQTCANAKAAGITVYTIGLATNKVTQSTQAVVQAMLTNCATTPDRARFPNQSSELKAVFESIANDLSALRLVR